MTKKPNQMYIIVLFLAIITTALSSACGGNGDEPLNPTVPDKPSEPGLFDNYTSDNVYSKNVQLLNKDFMQGFSIADDGTVWYTSVKGAEIDISHRRPNKDIEASSVDQEHMVLACFGHGTNTAIEWCDGDAYVWAGCYGSCTDKVNYWSEKLICRTKFLPGKTITTDQCDEYFYIGSGAYHVQPTVDTEHGHLAVQYNGMVSGNTVNFEIYDLEEAKNAPLKDVVIKCTDGFKTGDRTSVNEIETTVRVHDLTAIKPIASARCAWQTDPRATYYSWQGYDINGDRLYFVEGNDNGFSDSKASMAYLTVYDLNGSVVVPRTQIKPISDRNFLAENGISVSCTLESEGVKVKNGKIYLGFCNRGITSESRSPYQTVFSFNLK